MRRTSSSLLVVLALAIAQGCGGGAQPTMGAHMTPEVVASHGRRAFPAPRAKVAAAVVGALKALGYAIAFADEEGGILKTAPKDLRSEAYAAGSQVGYGYRGQSVLVTYARAYALRLTTEQEVTIVEATPRVFANGKDISSDPVWALGGPNGEYQLWDQLFSEIASNLGVTPRAPRAPALSAAVAPLPLKPPGLPGGSFEEQPSTWLLGPTSIIQSQVAHKGSRALEIRLDRGLGSRQVTRSAYLTDVALGPDYEISFYYRYERCASAIFTVQAGAYEKRLSLSGSDATWRRESMVVSFTKKPAWVDIATGRMGAASSYEGPQFDNNVLWIDDIEIALKQ